MGFIFGFLFNFCYSICNSYLIALIIFTLLTKIILIPISVIVQRNSIKSVQMLPEINTIKATYFGDRDTINEHTLEVYKKHHYNPFIDVIPLVLQLIILFGVIDVVTEPSLAQLTSENMFDMGINFYAVTAETWGLYILFPIFAAFSSFLMCFIQNRVQVLQSEQNKATKYGTLILSVGLSLYLGFFVSAGVATYWVFSNIFSIVQLIVLNALISPMKHVDYAALEKSKKMLADLKTTGTKLTREQRIKQNKDFKQFFSVLNKHIVFYSEKSGFYKYYKGIIEWLVANSNVTIHYITSDYNDIIFDIASKNNRIRAYFIGERKLITLFMKMDADIVVMTTPDLENYYLKRSYVRKDVEYIYTEHAISDINMNLREKALDNFDTIFCTTSLMRREIEARERLHNLSKKNLVNVGYSLLDDLLISYKSMSSLGRTKPIALIAPSHQIENILESCLSDVVCGLKKAGYDVIVRPHPQFLKRKPELWKDIEKTYETDSAVQLESDFSSNETIYTADLLITDWSCIGFEYSFTTLRPTLFIDTPMKVINPNYKELGIEPLNVVLRNKVGISVADITSDNIAEVVSNMNMNAYKTDILKIRNELVYNVGNSDAVAGNYILNKLMEE